MITSLWTPFKEQMQVIDCKSYEWPWLDEAWDDKSVNFRVAVDNTNKVQGFSCFSKVGNGFFVSKLCVRPKYRRLGVGGRLHKDLLAIAKESKVLRLEAILHQDNAFFSWAHSWDWMAARVCHGLFPDGSDGYVFLRGVEI